MPTIPNCDQAAIEPTKVSDYLLSDTHPVGRYKARFFQSFGFHGGAPDELANALLAHVRLHPAVGIWVSVYGTKYRVDGPITSPDGRDPLISTVWIILYGERIPRFITAFPC